MLATREGHDVVHVEELPEDLTSYDIVICDYNLKNGKISLDKAEHDNIILWTASSKYGKIDIPEDIPIFIKGDSGIKEFIEDLVANYQQSREEDPSSQ